MEQKNTQQHLIPSNFASTAFNSSFSDLSGLNAAGNVPIMETLSQLGLGNQILQSAAAASLNAAAAQWAAAAQPATTNWMDPKVASLLLDPKASMYNNILTASGVKSIETLSSDILAHSMPAGSAPSCSTVNSPSSTFSVASIFPLKPTLTAATTAIGGLPHNGSIPNAHHIAQQHLQNHATASTAVTQLPSLHIKTTTPSCAQQPISVATTSSGGGDHVNFEESWNGFDLGDIDLFAAPNSKDKEMNFEYEALFTHANEKLPPTQAASTSSKTSSTSTPSAVDSPANAAIIPNNGAVPSVSSTGTSTTISSSVASAPFSLDNAELLDADKELDRFLSMVAARNSSSTPSSSTPKASTSKPLFNFALPSTSVVVEDPQLSPVQFTPPDSPAVSPRPGPSTSALPAPRSQPSTSRAAAAPSISLPLPSVLRTPTKSATSRPSYRSTKVPIYKQKLKEATAIIDPFDDPAKDDTYSFTDDEFDDQAPIDVVGLTKADELAAAKLTKPGSLDARKSSSTEIAGAKRKDRPSLPGQVIPLESQPSVLPMIEKSELALLIEKRKRARLENGFLQSRILDGTEILKEELKVDTTTPVCYISPVPAPETPKEPGDHPPLPKLIIRMPKRVVDDFRSWERKEKKRKKRKKNKKEKDHEWEGSDLAKRKKRHKKHKKQHSKESYEWSSRFAEPDEYPSSYFDDIPKRRRLYTDEYNGETQETSMADDFDVDTIRRRLSKFQPAVGTLSKGTFVVAKQDVFSEDCALWRVDNMNLLQKFPARKDPDTHNIVYRNSSTYSGWCDQISGGYFVIKIRYLKHTRSETIVEPEIPLAELFPALTAELPEASTSGAVKTEEGAEDFFGKDPQRALMGTFIQALLHHALTLDFLQNVKEKNEWTYLQALTDVDKTNRENIEKLRARVKWNEKFEEFLSLYAAISINDLGDLDVLCQACATKTAEKMVQLFLYEKYNSETLLPETENNDDEPLLPAHEFAVCSLCSKMAVLNHRALHMKLAVLRKCEDELEEMANNRPELKGDALIDACMKHKSWLSKVTSECTEVWRQLQTVDF